MDDILAVSLNKYIAQTGFCSRREADEYIRAGRVSVNKKKVLQPGMRVQAGDRVSIDGEPLKASTRAPVYIAFNKPVGVTSTTDPKDRTNIIRFIGYPKRIFPIGRLDKDSQGLILLTNDGDMVNKVLRATNGHEKEYLVDVDKPIDDVFLRQMAQGVPILDTITQPAQLKREGRRRFRIILKQGLNRQIRRMCAHLGYRVQKLVRIRIMHIPLEGIPEGKWRHLYPEEMRILHKRLADSQKTADPQAHPAKTEKSSPKVPRPQNPDSSPTPAKPKKDGDNQKTRGQSYKAYRKNRKTSNKRGGGGS